MKETKRLLSACLSIILLISAIATSVVSATSDIPEFDETKLYIKATSEPVKAGDIAKVTFTIGNNKSFWGIHQTYKFDTSVLSFVEGETNEYGTFPKYDKGVYFRNSLISPINDKGEFTFIFTEIYNDDEIKSNESNGELFSIYLKVADNAQPGSYKIEMVDYKAENYIALSGKPVAFTFNQPTVEVYDPALTTTTTTTTVTQPADPSNPDEEETSSSTQAGLEQTESTQTPIQSTTVEVPAQSVATVPTTPSVTDLVVNPTNPTEKHTHTIELANVKKATYFEKGYTGDKVCADCNEVIENGTEIAVLKLQTPKFTAKRSGKKIKIGYKKVAGATKFQVRYRIKGKWKMQTFSAKKNVTKFTKKLKKGNYKVQVRAMAVKGKLKAYSAWAKAKNVKIK